MAAINTIWRCVIIKEVIDVSRDPSNLKLGYETVRVTAIDHVNMRIEGEHSLLMELHEYFAFRPPNYQWSPLFKSKVWDGKIRLFKLNPQTIYRGLLPQLQSWADRLNYSIEYTDEIALSNNISLVEAANFIKGLNLPHVPHQHQVEGFLNVARRNRSIELAATGSGKSMLAYMLVRYFDVKTLIITTKTGLAAQMVANFAEYGGATWALEHCHMVTAGIEKSSAKPIVITTWQSVYRQPKTYFQQYQMVIGDEAHHYDAKSMMSIMEKMSNAKIRIGLTGRLEDSKVHELILQGLFGPIHEPATSKQLRDRGVIAEPKLKVIMLKHTLKDCQKFAGGKDYRAEREFVITHSKRNTFICNLALSLKGNTLVLYRFVEAQGKPLYEELLAQSQADKPIFFINKDTSAEDRELIRLTFGKLDNAILIASTGTFVEGSNIPTLNNAIMATPVKSKITVLQSIGRLLRVKDDKTSAEIYDIVDDLTNGPKINYLMKHAIARMQLYKKSEFSYKTYRVQL